MVKKSHRRSFTRRKGYTKKRGASKNVNGSANSVTVHYDSTGPGEVLEFEPMLVMECDEVEVWDSHLCETDKSVQAETVNNYVYGNHGYSNTREPDPGKWNVVSSESLSSAFNYSNAHEPDRGQGNENRSDYLPSAISSENLSYSDIKDTDKCNQNIIRSNALLSVISSEYFSNSDAHEPGQGKRNVMVSDSPSSAICSENLSDSNAQDFGKSEHYVIMSDSPSSSISYGHFSDSTAREFDQGERKVIVSDSMSAANSVGNFRDHLMDHNYAGGIPPNIVVSDRSLYEELKQKCMDISQARSFSLLFACEYIRFIKVSDSDFPTVKVCVTIDKTFNTQIKVLSRDLPSNHELWFAIPIFCNSILDVATLLNIMDSYDLCQGNSDSHLVDLVSLDSSLDVAREKGRAAFKDSSSGAPTVRSTSCEFLTKSGRCSACMVYRRTLTKALYRHKKAVVTPNTNLIRSTIPADRLSEAQKIEKIKQLRIHVNSLQSEIGRLNRKLNRFTGKDRE